MNICEFQATCTKVNNCDVMLDNDHNAIENLVFIPDCYKEKPKINQTNEGNLDERQFKK